MKKILALSSLCLTSLIAQAQWGIRVIPLDVDHERTLGGLRFGVGADVDLANKYALGIDVLVAPRTSGIVDVSDETGKYVGSYNRSGREYSTLLHASHLVSGKDGASFTVGPIAGLRYGTESMELENGAGSMGSPTSNYPERLERDHWLVPMGFRVGIRDGIKRGYLDFHVRWTYELGGGGPVFNVGTSDPERIGDAPYRIPQWRIGFGAAFGFCAGGCDRAQNQLARRERKRLKKEGPRVVDMNERPWGIRVIGGELTVENTRRGGPSGGLVVYGFEPPGFFSGIGFDLDLDKRWSLGFEALIDPRASFGRTLAGGSYYDPAAEVLHHGQFYRRGTRIHYEQTGSAYAVNARGAYRFSNRRRSSPYVAGWAGLRIDHIVLRNPRPVFASISGDWFSLPTYFLSGEEYVLSSTAPASMTTTRITAPVGARLGLDMRAGRTYYDIYLYGAYKIGHGRDYFDMEMDATTESSSGLDVRGVMRDYPYSVGVGAAIGIGRRTYTTKELKLN